MATPETKINRSDLQTYPSERLTDNDDGGGMPLGTPISGEANELFNPISSIARINGGFYLRLVYAGVQRIDDEPLIGSFAAITKPPSDDTVSYLLSRATKFGELRHESLDRIEAYQVASIESRMTLLSTQSQNSKIIQAYQRVGEPLPLVGDVYCLRQDKAGYVKREQYIQVSRVTSEDRTFVTQVSSSTPREFTVTVVKMEISNILEADFIGVDYPVEGYIDAPCKIRETSVADAAQYYGIKPLAEAIAADTQTIRIPSLMEKIVPTNQIETFLTNLTAAGQRQTLFDGAKAGADGVVTLAINKSHAAGTTSSIYLGNAAVPNSVSIATNAGAITDKGGTLMLGDVAVGTIRQSAGELLINAPSYTGYITSVSFRPAGSELQVANTARENVTINNRSNLTSLNIDPPPAPGSLQVSYRAQGQWYDLRDDGTGVLRGASAAHGSGNINFATGSAQATMGELPDVGSAIIYSWGTRARYFNRSDSATSAKMVLQLAQAAVPSTISLGWDDGSGLKTAVSDARGNITGAWTGKYDSRTRQIRIDTSANFNHPVGALDIQVAYSTSTPASFNVTLSALDSNQETTFTALPFLRNTLNIRYQTLLPFEYSTLHNSVGDYTVRDDGVGNLLNDANIIIGSIDYVTGVGKFKPAVTRRLSKPVYVMNEVLVGNAGAFGNAGGSGGGIQMISPILKSYEYVDVDTTLSTTATTLADATAFEEGTANAVTEQLASGPIEIDMLPTFAEIVMPSSVNFTWSGKTYFDKNGSIYTDLDASTGVSTPVGSIDYQAAKVTLRNWQWVNATQPTLKSLATSLTGNPVSAVTFRTPSAPIKPGSLALRATAIDGTLVSAKANLSGELSAANISGFVDTEYGLGDVQFGNWVTATGNESEPWYDADAIRDDGKIWRAKLVFANTITYDTRSFSFLPIDSNVVKIDTVRLPQDGRIPIFRRGDTIIIGNRVTTDIGSAHTGGQTVTLPRNDVTRIAVVDADDKNVNAALWDYDLAAGTVTWKTPLDLSSYQMPLKVMHAQEERNRIIQADIDGTLTLLFAMRRAYPIADTYVSSVLIGGDLQVRVSIPFTQRNWNNVWQDTPVGDQLLNKLNLKDYPMILTDDGAIKERWMIKMTGTAQFELYGETLGFVMRGDTLTDLAPINPATGKPYFTLPKQAFGADAPWANQDIIRFNTWGTLLPVLVLCAVQPNPNPPTGTDGYTMCLYGDTTEINV